MNFSDILKNLFGSNQETLTLNIIGGTKGNNNYVDMLKGDRTELRKLYHNTNKNFALSGHFVKPVVNNNVNFIGIPELFGNKKALKVIDDVKIDYRKIHKSIEIDGTVFIWIQWDMEHEEIKLVQIPISVVNEIFVDPVTKEITGYHFSETVTYNSYKLKNAKVTIDHIITKDIVVSKIEGSINKTTKMANPFGMIPIVRFSNDRDEDKLYGHSEFEGLAPQLRFYHEVSYEAGAAQSRDGHPKLKVNTKNVKQWIDNNFGAGTYANILAGNGTVSMDDRDLFINAEGEDVNYLYLNKTSGDYAQLTKTIFTNIVEGSEIPEVNFGANIGTSLASVKEYRPVWIKKIEAKQYERTAPWLKVYDMIIMVHNFIHFKTIKSDDIEIKWTKPNFSSTKEQADIIKTFSDAMIAMLDAGLISNEEVYETLKQLDILYLSKDFKSHEKVIDDEQSTKKTDGDKETPTD